MSLHVGGGVAVLSDQEEVHGLSSTSLKFNIEAHVDEGLRSGFEESSPFSPVFASVSQEMDVGDNTSRPNKLLLPKYDQSPPSKLSRPALTANFQTERNGFVTTQDRLMQQLYLIQCNFFDTEDIKNGILDSDWMLKGKNSSSYAKVLLGMIKDIRLLCIKTTLVYESMNPISDRVRSKLADIVQQMERIAEVHSDVKRSGGRNTSPMKEVQDELLRLRKLMRAYKTLPKDKTKTLEILEEQLKELHDAIKSYIENSMEPIPRWIIEANMKDSRSVEDEFDEEIWSVQKPIRMRRAQKEALDTYTSFKELNSEIARTRRRLKPPHGKNAKAPAKLPQFAIESDSEEETESTPQPTSSQLAQEAETISNRHLKIIADSTPLSSALKSVMYLAQNTGTFSVEAWTEITAALNFAYKYNFHPYNEDAISSRESKDVRVIFEFLKKAVDAIKNQDDVASQWFDKYRYGVPLDVLNELSIERKDLEEENASLFAKGTEDEFQYRCILQASNNVIYLTEDVNFDMARLQWMRLGLGFQYMLGLYAKDKDPAAKRTVVFVSKVARQLSRINLKVAKWFEEEGVIFEETDELLELVQNNILQEAEQHMANMPNDLSADDKQLVTTALQSVINLFSNSVTFLKNDFAILEASHRQSNNRLLYTSESKIDDIIRFLDRAMRFSWKRKMKSEISED